MILKKFGSFCSRLTAGLLSIPTVLAGVGVAMGGGVASMGLWVPGLIVGMGVGMATRDIEKGGQAASAVTYSVVALGVAMVGIGLAASAYASTKENLGEASLESVFSSKP